MPDLRFAPKQPNTSKGLPIEETIRWKANVSVPRAFTYSLYRAQNSRLKKTRSVSDDGIATRRSELMFNYHHQVGILSCEGFTAIE